MNVRSMRLVLGLFFLFAGLSLLVLRFAGPEVLAEDDKLRNFLAKFDPVRIVLGSIFALVMAGWNLTKWYAATLDSDRRATPVRQPFQREPDAVREEEP